MTLTAGLLSNYQHLGPKYTHASQRRRVSFDAFQVPAITHRGSVAARQQEDQSLKENFETSQAQSGEQTLFSL